VANENGNDGSTDSVTPTDPEPGSDEAEPGEPEPEPEPEPEEMSIDELRREIETIDRELVELIAQRTYVADTVARVKADQDLATTDEDQERAVMDRAGENASNFEVDSNLVKAIFRLLIELNKIEQRERR